MYTYIYMYVCTHVYTYCARCFREVLMAWNRSLKVVVFFFLLESNSGVCLLMVMR